LTAGKIEIDGELYRWASTTPGATSPVVVSWHPRPGGSEPVEIGRLKRWSDGQGWVVIPRLGGLVRARRDGKGLGRTRATAIRQLVDLARSEACLSVVEKVSLNIIRDDGRGGLIDASASLPPAPCRSPD
jgi:hypothetical protein